MGPSGSGKTTLLDALFGRLPPAAVLSGSILLNGRKAKLSFGSAAYVTQDDNLIATLSVHKTISYDCAFLIGSPYQRNSHWLKAPLQIWVFKIVHTLLARIGTYVASAVEKRRGSVSRLRSL